MTRSINTRISAWIEYFKQRDLVNQMRNEGLQSSPVYEQEKKRMNDLETKAKNHKP